MQNRAADANKPAGAAFGKLVLCREVSNRQTP
jgi:hypothetical protein